MFYIFFNHRVLCVCSPTDSCLQEPNTTIFYPCEGVENNAAISDIPTMFERSTEMLKLCIPCDNQELTYKQICSSFIQINAGGGLVENSEGEVLMILRNGIWDLPKGKQEPAEDIRESALREVREECGISHLAIKELLCITNHTYRLDGKFILKHTYWYKMIYDAAAAADTLIPQTEENISRAEWVPKNRVAQLLKNSYPSILEVFKSASIADR